jgi:hypothetical protein
MNQEIEKIITGDQVRPERDVFKVGDTVSVYAIVKE